MYKSVFTFGLLASSLVMLVLVPFLNNNSAMAQEYDKYGDSSYSQYPTDDKKYECQTGPFEGFFVSSVEFCKHVKFDKDDRKDNKIIKQEHKVHLVQQVQPVHKENSGPIGQFNKFKGIQATRSKWHTGPSGITAINET